MAKLIELIFVEEKRGKGAVDDPVRLVEQYWTKKGNLLFEYDPIKDEVVKK